MTHKERRKLEVSALADIIKDCALHDAEKTIKELQAENEQLRDALEKLKCQKD
jgi:hypothetical protein